MTTQLMADSTRPWLIPASFQYAAAYANGLFTWTDDQIDRFAGHVKIAVFAGDPSQARIARELDIERFDAGPADAAPFIEERRKIGNDGTLYVNRDNSDPAPVPTERQHSGLPDLGSVRWHVATLDGTRSVPVPFGILWAVQFETVAGAYDVSIVYGPYDWSRQ